MSPETGSAPAGSASPFAEQLPPAVGRLARGLAARCPTESGARTVPVPAGLRRPGPADSSQARTAAVMVVLYPLAEDELGVVLTRRRGDLRQHAGEISFPGGRTEEGDRDLLHTALREAEEEIGLASAEVRVLGSLRPTSTFATNYEIWPFVGLISSERRWRLSPREVDAVLEVSLQEIRSGRTRTRVQARGISFQTGAYVVGEDVIWGATARILKDLLALLDHA